MILNPVKSIISTRPNMFLSSIKEYETNPLVFKQKFEEKQYN